MKYDLEGAYRLWTTENNRNLRARYIVAGFDEVDISSADAEREKDLGTFILKASEVSALGAGLCWANNEGAELSACRAGIAENISQNLCTMTFYRASSDAHAADLAGLLLLWESDKEDEIAALLRRKVEFLCSECVEDAKQRGLFDSLSSIITDGNIVGKRLRQTVLVSALLALKKYGSVQLLERFARRMKQEDDFGNNPYKITCKKLPEGSRRELKEYFSLIISAPAEDYFCGRTIAHLLKCLDISAATCEKYLDYTPEEIFAAVSTRGRAEDPLYKIKSKLFPDMPMKDYALMVCKSGTGEITKNWYRWFSLFTQCEELLSEGKISEYDFMNFVKYQVIDFDSYPFEETKGMEQQAKFLYRSIDLIALKGWDVRKFLNIIKKGNLYAFDKMDFLNIKGRRTQKTELFDAEQIDFSVEMFDKLLNKRELYSDALVFIYMNSHYKFVYDLRRFIEKLLERKVKNVDSLFRDYPFDALVLNKATGVFPADIVTPDLIASSYNRDSLSDPFATRTDTASMRNLAIKLYDVSRSGLLEEYSDENRKTYKIRITKAIRHRSGPCEIEARLCEEIFDAEYREEFELQQQLCMEWLKAMCGAKKYIHWYEFATEDFKRLKNKVRVLEPRKTGKGKEAAKLVLDTMIALSHDEEMLMALITDLDISWLGFINEYTYFFKKDVRNLDDFSPINEAECRRYMKKLTSSGLSDSMKMYLYFNSVLRISVKLEDYIKDLKVDIGSTINICLPYDDINTYTVPIIEDPAKPSPAEGEPCSYILDGPFMLRTDFSFYTDRKIGVIPDLRASIAGIDYRNKRFILGARTRYDRKRIDPWNKFQHCMFRLKQNIDEKTHYIKDMAVYEREIGNLDTLRSNLDFFINGRINEMVRLSSAIFMRANSASTWMSYAEMFGEDDTNPFADREKALSLADEKSVKLAREDLFKLLENSKNNSGRLILKAYKKSHLHLGAPEEEVLQFFKVNNIEL